LALLSEEELADIDIPQSAVDELYSMVLPTLEPDTNRESDHSSLFSGVFGEADAEIALQSITDQNAIEEDDALFTTKNPLPIYTSSEQFVTAYSKFNEVNNTALATVMQGSDANAIASTMQRCCMFGGSRKPPAPKMFKCQKTPGCTRVECSRELITWDESVCSLEYTARYASGASQTDDTAQYTCSNEGCNFQPGPGSSDPANVPAHHVRDIHKWVPKPCTRRCDPGTVYATQSAHNSHIIKMHSSSYPATCSCEGCTSTATYSSRGVLQRHLRGLHDLESFGDVLPYLSQSTARKCVVGQVCWLEGCSIESEERGKMRNRLMSKKHDMSEDEADASVQANAEFQVPALKPSKKRVLSTKELELH
jgi:hypothetical protein